MEFPIHRPNHFFLWIKQNMTRTRIKFCGIRRTEDALFAVDLDVDAIGLMFYEKSARYITFEQAQQIAKNIPAFVTTVGVFVNAEHDYVQQAINQVHFNCLQFQGDENAVFCESFSLPYIKAIRVQENMDVLAEVKQFSSASAIILDAYHAQQYGGSGQTFNWQHIPDNFPAPLILAGGLMAANVAQAIQQIKPYGLDVSSGIESSPGIKDLQKMQQFVAAVQAADHARNSL